VPNNQSGPRCFEIFCNKKFLRWGVAALRPTPSPRTTPCRLSATAYSIYSQLPSVPGGLPFIGNLSKRHAVVTRDPPNVDPCSTVGNNLSAPDSVSKLTDHASRTYKENICAICGGQSGAKAEVLRKPRVSFLPNYHSTGAPSPFITRCMLQARPVGRV
jgi:hypothetical protein